jgi:hypothetical protein
MKLLAALCRANQSILKQKVGLMEALMAKHGPDSAREVYKMTCPIVKASLGQHIRHSMDHIEAAVLSALDDDVLDIHYDLRTRGGSDEYDWDEASKRLQRVADHLEHLASRTEVDTILDRPVKACFLLSGDSEQEYPLTSTVSRELGFAVHHSIHHMAMVRIIATCDHVGKLDETVLPSDFGRAPSTVNFDNRVDQQ